VARLSKHVVQIIPADAAEAATRFILFSRSVPIHLWRQHSFSIVARLRRSGFDRLRGSTPSWAVLDRSKIILSAFIVDEPA